ncbi:MAG: hypothetical protein V1725_02395 [archaeon]
MTRHERNWTLVCSQLPKHIFNIYFSGWKTQQDVSHQLGNDNPNRHVSHYKNLFLKAKYIREERRHEPTKPRTLVMGTGTIQPYADYLRAEHPELYSPKSMALLQLFIQTQGMRQLIIKDDKNIIQGMNDMLLLYWQTKNTLSLLKPHNGKNLTLTTVLHDTGNFLAQQFSTIERAESSIWNKQEQAYWWQQFVAAHGIDPAFLLTFKDALARTIKKHG